MPAGSSRPSSSSSGHQLHAGVQGGRPELEGHQVRPGRPATTACPGVARTRMATWLAMVPEGTNSGGLFAHPLGVALLQTADGGVLAEPVVAHLGLGHGPAHRRAWVG